MSPAATIGEPTAPAGGGQRARSGSVVAVCGLGGGLGTTTLAQLLATSLARASEGPVLLADGGGPVAALSTRCGVEAPLSLADAATALASGSLTSRPFEPLEAGLRLLARRPLADSGERCEGVEELLLQAARAHTLTVVDCGTLQRPIEQQLLSGADSVVWVCSSRRAELVRAETAIAALGALAPERGVAAVYEDHRGQSSERDAIAFGDRSRLPVALLPRVEADLRAPELLEAALGLLGPHLNALAGALR